MDKSGEWGQRQPTTGMHPSEVVTEMKWPAFGEKRKSSGAAAQISDELLILMCDHQPAV